MRIAALNAHRIVVTDRSPVLGETSYDRTTSALWTLFLLLGCLCVLLIAIWLQSVDDSVPRPFINSGNAVHQSMVIEQPRSRYKLSAIQVPDDITDSASQQVSENRLSQLYDTVTSTSVIESATRASNRGQVSDQGETRVEPGRTLLHRQPPRRWFFEIVAPRSAREYGRMLDHFGVELGAVFEDGHIVYLSGLSSAPQVRRSSHGDPETRFFTRWSSGDMLLLDRDLFSAAGVDISEARLVQFLPSDTERMLEEQEKSFAGSDLPERSTARGFSLFEQEVDSKLRFCASLDADRVLTRR